MCTHERKDTWKFTLTRPYFARPSAGQESKIEMYVLSNYRKCMIEECFLLCKCRSATHASASACCHRSRIFEYLREYIKISLS
jgi:hypothetical protein